MKTKVIRCTNSTVTDYYLSIIEKALGGIESSKEITVVAQFQDAINAFLKNENVVFWTQGLVAEEHYMRHHNVLKRIAIDILNRYALKRATFNVFVSKSMKDHFEKKYHIHFSERNYYIMPCFNTSIHEQSFLEKNKYKNNVFTYIGSMEAWQGVDNILACYKTVENYGLPNTCLEIYTADQELALQKIKNANIINYKIGFVNNEELPNVLGKVKYGFILRQDNIVNRVSTPTKISTYLSCGVIPIYSKCIDSFNEIAQNMTYVVEENEVEDLVKKFSEEDIDPIMVLSEYQKVFDTYYSARYHAENLRKKLVDIV